MTILRGSGAIRGGDDLHAGGRLADAGRGEHALALDLDHAGAAVAVGPVAGLGQPAQMRDVDALAGGHLPDGLACAGLDLTTIQRERDRIGHHGNLNLSASSRRQPAIGPPLPVNTVRASLPAVPAAHAIRCAPNAPDVGVLSDATTIPGAGEFN
jgi:hypothetical protein